MKAQNSQSLFISPAILPLQTEIADVTNLNTNVMCLWIGILPKNSLGFFFFSPPIYLLPWWLSSKESACSAGDGHVGLIPGSGRSSGGGYGNPLQYFCQENPMDRGAWPATVHGVTQRECTGHSKHPFSPIQEMTLHMDITKWSMPKSN